MRKLILYILCLVLLASCSTMRFSEKTDRINDIGIKCLENKMFQDAIFWFEKTIEIDGQNESALNNIAICFEALGHYKEALEYYEKAYAISKNTVILANINSLKETVEL